MYTKLIAGRGEPAFPWATFLVNIGINIVLGLLAVWGGHTLSMINA